MLKNENVFGWLFEIGMAAVVVWCLLFVLIYLLPILLIVGGLYFVYVFVKTWLQNDMKIVTGQRFNSVKSQKKQGKVIDAEFEVLDEKVKE